MDKICIFYGNYRLINIFLAFFNLNLEFRFKNVRVKWRFLWLRNTSGRAGKGGTGTISPFWSNFKWRPCGWTPQKLFTNGEADISCKVFQILFWIQQFLIRTPIFWSEENLRVEERVSPHQNYRAYGNIIDKLYLIP